MPDQKRVLIVDDDRHLTKALATRLGNLGLDVLTASDGLSAMKIIPSKKPDLVILDINMPAGSGMTVCTVLAHDRDLAPIPVIIMTGRTDQDTINKCEQLGAHYLKKSPQIWDDLRPLVFEMLDTKDDAPIQTPTPKGTEEKTTEAPERTQPKVLIIDDDPDICKAMQIKLGAYGLDVIRAYNGMQGYWTALREKPDFIIIDYMLPEGRGNYVLGRLRSHSITQNTPAIIITGKTIDGKRDYALERELIAIGAEKYLTKPIDFNTLLDILRQHIPVPDHPVGRPKNPKATAIGIR